MFGWFKSGGVKDSAISVAVLVKGARKFADPPKAGREEREFSLDALAARLKSRGIKAERRDDAPRESLGMRFNDHEMMIAPQFPAVPAGQLLELAEGAWWWPEAHERCRDHSHVVAVGVPAGRGDPLERRRVASEVALAIAREHDAPAILWRDGETLNEPDTFQRALDAERPIPLWVAIRVAELASTRFFFSTGMEAFDHREIEMDVPPRESLDQAEMLHTLIGLALRERARLVPGVNLGGQLVVSIEASRIPGRRDVVRLRW